MLQSIINFLNLKLDLLNYFDLTRCLCELKEDSEGKVSPEEYISNGNWDNIDFDAHNGVSYWRLRDEITVTPLDNSYRAGKRVETIVPLKLVFSVPRTKLTADDAYSYDRIRQTIVKQFNIDDGTLKTTLGAEKILITSPTANGDAKAVWDGETADTGTHEPKYEVVFGSVDIDISIISKGECLPTECDDVDSDILHAFDFCNESVINRLTDKQETCLIAALCGVPSPATINVNGNLWAMVASGATLAGQVHDTADNDVGTIISTTEIEIADSTNQVNGVDISDPTLAEGTHNQEIHNSSGVDVGTAANPSIVGDSTINVNGVLFDTFAAERIYPLSVKLDGVESGTFDVPNKTVNVTSNLQSVSLSVSDDTPEFGETITITATPTNITPTNYIFLSVEGDTYTEIGDQASNVLNWDVNILGTFEITVIAEDATDKVADCISVTSSATYFLDTYPNGIGGYSVVKLRSAYTGALVKIRRSSDNAVKDFYPDGSDKLSLTSEDGAGTSLGTWIGSDNGFINVWYAQALTGADITQATAGNQPQIVSSGALITGSNGLAAPTFGSASKVSINSFLGHSTFDFFCASSTTDTKFVRLRGDGTAKVSFVAESGGSGSVLGGYGSPTLYVDDVVITQTRNDIYNALSGGTVKIVTHQGADTSTWSAFDYGGYPAFEFAGIEQCMVAWSSDQSANRSAMVAALQSIF